MRRRWARFDGPARLVGVDLARGLAVVGMLAAHLLTIEPFDPAVSATWVDVVNGRSSILFATLAGVSIGLVTGGTRPVRGPARSRASARLALRAGLLWMLGILLIATGVPVYVILPAYAILFLLSLPFLGLGAPALFLIAGVIALVMPFVQVLLDAAPLWQTAAGEQLDAVLGWHYPFPTWIAFLLAGLGLARCDLRSTRVAAIALAAGAALAAVGYSLDAAPLGDAEPFFAQWWTALPHSTGLLEVIGSGGFAIAVIGASLLVCRTFVRWIAVPLRAVGSMPLTAYTVQLVVWAVIAAIALGDPGDLVGFRDLAPFWPMTLALIVGCTAWVVLVGRGPLEAAIDRFTRWVVRSPERRLPVDRLEG